MVRPRRGAVLGPSESDNSSDFGSEDDSRPPKKKIPRKDASAIKKKPASKRVLAGHSSAARSSHVAAAEPAPDSDEDEEELGHRPQAEYDEDDLTKMTIPPPPRAVMSRKGGKRLMIKDIVVENFKSYFGKRHIGPFHHNFTSIIGPNGSGKSNVIDSLLFVFGYKASKIRSKKLSVLIHSSAGNDDIRSCSVQINFQEIEDLSNGGYKVVPNSEFSVSRTAYKNNSSDYHLNDKKMSIKEIAKKLRAVGIDLVHNRFLILQGEVEQIAMMKPKAQNPNEEGMLEYLEDIIGSSRFKEPIEKLTSKMSQLQQDRSHQNTHVNKALQDKEALEGPAFEMIEHMRVENRHAILSSKQLYRKKYKTEDLVAEQEPRVVEMKEEYEKCQEELNEVLERQTEKKKLIKQLDGELEEASRALQTVENELGVLAANEQKRNNDTARVSAEVTKLQRYYRKEAQKLNEAREAPVKAAQDIEVLNNSEDDRQDAIRAAQEQFDLNFPRYTKRTEAEREKKAVLEEEFGELAAKKTEAEVQLRLAESELATLVEDEEKKKRILGQIEESIEEIRRQLKEKNERLDQLKKVIPDHEKTLKTMEENVKKWKERKAAIEPERHRLEALLDASESTAATTQSMSRVLKALLEEKKRGKIPGFFGRLGDLGSIDPKYDVAISTTCGALDNYVVDTVQTADECIDILRQGNHGKGTFIALDKQMGLIPHMLSTAKYPFDAPRLFDLVKVDDPRIKPAFYFALRETIVAQDIDQATLISKKGRFRIVTLKAELIETSGAMSGGGVPTEGRIGQRRDRTKSRAEEENDRTAAADAREKFKALKAELEILNGDILKVDQSLLKATSDVRKEKIDADRLDTDIKSLKDREKVQCGQLEEIRKKVGQVAADEKQVQRLRNNISELHKNAVKARQEADACRKKIDVVDAEIRKINDKMLKPHEERLAQAKKAQEDAEKKISELQAVINGADRLVKKHKTRYDELEKEIDKKRGKTTDLINMEGVYAKSINENMSKKKILEEKVREVEEKRKETREGNSALDTHEVDLQRKLKKLHDEIRDENDKLKSNKHLLRSFAKDIENIKLKDVKFWLDEMPQSVQEKEKAKPVFLLDSDESEDEEMNEDEEETEETEDIEGEGIKKKKDTEKKKKKKQNKQAGTQEIGDDGVLPVWTREQLQEVDWEKVKLEKEADEKWLAARKGKINPHILSDFKNKVEVFKRETELLQSISLKYTTHRNFLEKLKKDRLHEFMSGFECISFALRRMYQMITLGGDASLEMKDLIDPFIEGVQLMVRPPKKSWKQIENLSGGEKTLSSLALVFALHQYRPTPLYIMDEIDAALDFRNVSIIGHYIKDRTKNAQFIIISLRNNMFELADRLIGIYKVHDCTHNVVIDPKRVLESTADMRRGLERLKKIVEERQDLGDLLNCTKTDINKRPTGANVLEGEKES